MNVQSFLILFMLLSTLNALVTQAVKKMLDDGHKTYASNKVALVDGLIIGCDGTVIYYLLTNTQFNLVNTICIVLMGFAIWLGSMVGYDKVVQYIKQIQGIK